MAIDFESMVPTAAGPDQDTATYAAPEAERRRSRVLQARTRARTAGSWTLESPNGNGSSRRTPITPIPFQVGRSANLDLVLPSAHVSKHHAEIYSDGETLRVRDLGSRNGTFLNRQPVADAPLHMGDVLHFGDFEFTVANGNGAAPSSVVETVSLPPPQESEGAASLRGLLEKRAVTAAFQPIVSLPSCHVPACEALGRGRHPELPESPVELLEIAGAMGPRTQIELSQLFRRRAVEMVRDRPEPPILFLNTHPVEMEHPGLVESSGSGAVSPRSTWAWPTTISG
jgi:hypothetical protein